MNYLNGGIMHYSLYKINNRIQCENNTNFTDLKNNTIMDTFIQLCKDEVERAIE